MNVKLDFKKSAKRWEEYSFEYYKIGTDKFTDIIKFGLEISTFLLGFNVIWVQISINPFTYTTKIIFVTNLIVLLVSIIFGTLALCQANRFYNQAGTLYEKKSDKLYNYMLDTGKTEGTSYPKYLWKDLKEQYSLSPIINYFQLSCIMISFILSTIIGCLLMI